MIFIPLRFFETDGLGNYRPGDPLDLGVWQIQVITEDKDLKGSLIKLNGDDMCIHVMQSKAQINELIRVAVKSLISETKKDLRPVRR